MTDADGSGQQLQKLNSTERCKMRLTKKQFEATILDLKCDEVKLLEAGYTHSAYMKKQERERFEKAYAENLKTGNFAKAKK